MQFSNLETLTAIDYYAEHGYPWKLWDALRRDSPVHWYDTPDHAPFWAVTRHADILTVSRHPEVFSNTGRLRIFSRAEDELIREGLRAQATARGWDPDEPLDMIFMDDPRHRNFRLLTSRSFTPGNVATWTARMKELADEFASDFDTAMDRNESEGRPTDLVSEFAAKLPQAIICEMMGLPAGDWPDLLQWTNALVGAADADFLHPGEHPMLAAARATELMRDYFLTWIERGRANTDDVPGMVGKLIQSRVDDELLTEQQLQGYLTVLVAAGSETTRNALSGGVLALLENPDQLALLSRSPELMPSAVEEVLRWTSPVIQFARTALRDFELSGVRIRAGQDVGLFYPSANRDEEVFPDPYRFDVTRTPNHHLAFGHGSHFCLGANLARQELGVMLSTIVTRLPQLELAAPPKRVPHLHVGGIKTLYLRRARQS